jgi:transcriptional regulator with XRE-family HTH domain
VKREPAEVRQALGVAVRQLRAEQKMTQEALAERAAIHPHYVSDTERGLRKRGGRQLDLHRRRLRLDCR